MWWMFIHASLAGEEPLSTWAAQLEAAPPPADCRVTASDDELRVDCGGAVLLMSVPAEGDMPQHTALTQQLAPFADAGMDIQPPAQRSCVVSGVARDCLEARVTPSVGSPMTLLGGQPESAQWVAICMHRGSELPDVCKSIFSLEPH